MSSRYAEAPGTATFRVEDIPDQLYELWAPTMGWPSRTRPESAIEAATEHLPRAQRPWPEVAW